MAAIVS